MSSDIVRVLGVDPGLGITGFSVVDCDMRTPVLTDAGCLRINKKLSLEKRLKQIYDDLCQIISCYRPDVMVVEELYSHYNHPKTAIIMGHARGVIYLCAANNDLLVKSFSANRIKMSLTGSGHASKSQIQSMVKNRFNLNKLPEPPDTADAIAIALCYYNTMKF